MNQKIEITKYIIKKLNLNCPNIRSFKLWVNKIWHNPRTKENGGLRLTQEGFDLISKCDIRFYEVWLENKKLHFDNKFILWLDNNFQCPFYLGKEKIYFFNEKPAVQLILFSGDLDRYFRAQREFAAKQLDKPIN